MRTQFDDSSFSSFGHMIWAQKYKSSAIAERPRDALYQLKSCQLLACMPGVRKIAFDTSWSSR